MNSYAPNNTATNYKIRKYGEARSTDRNTLIIGDFNIPL